jgi:UDP-N-acetylmuramoyl-L-alanyl-D-glutamate--2,6-diaminopimelate ligase
VEIYSLIRSSKGSISYLVMEVSSQAVREMRVLGLEFNIVLLTNLSQDHLDYHKTFDDYKWSKGLLISRVQDKKENYVILNHDIPYFSFFHQLSLAKTVTFGLNKADYQARINEESIEGSDLTVTVDNVEHRFFLHLLGTFNVYNALSFLAIIDCLHLFEPDVITFLSQDLKIDGRMEMYDIRERQVIIDFAHTPEGIREVLTFLNMIKRKRIISIIGCGGDRDRSKRPLMGQITSELSDLVYFTEDNSRNEDPHNIISDIIAGVLRDNYVVEIDRKKAIRKAFEDSKEGDIIAILGKGHENYLITNNLKTHYSDKEEVLALKEEFK